MTCQDVMSTDFAACRETTPVAQVARLMRDHRSGVVVIVDGARHPIGVVTDRDLVVRALANEQPARLPIGEIMTRPPLLTCRAEDDLIELEGRMSARRCSRALVVDQRGVLAGLVTLGDIARAESNPARTGTLLSHVSREGAPRP